MTLNPATAPQPGADDGLVADLATANHILYDQKVVDAFGHVSVRHDKRPDRFLLARNMAPSLVTPEDIVEFDLDGNAIDARGRKVYLERFIHSEIYRVRADVGAVVHSHSHAVIPFGAMRSQSLRAILHMGGFIGTQAPVFEIRECAGDGSDLLIRSSELGAALAKSLGPKSVVLMRGHGATVVGATLREAVYRGVYVDVNARLQLQAIALCAAQAGAAIDYLTEAEGEAAARTTGSQIERAWEMWKHEARSRRS